MLWKRDTLDEFLKRLNAFKSLSARQICIFLAEYYFQNMMLSNH